MKPDPTSEEADWDAHARGDGGARERLIERHIPLVWHFARRIQPRAGGLELDELVSAGLVGLLKAVDRFRPELGYRFSTFAAPRIRGSILDELRRRDAIPRTVRRRQRRVARTEERLAGELDRLPRHQEVALVLGIEASTLWHWKNDTVRCRSVSLDSALSRAQGAGRPGLRLAELVGGDGLEVEDRLTREQEVARLRSEMEALDARERLVLGLYDFDQRKLREIAELLDVTESRVSQIRTRAIRRLRSRMGDLRGKVAA